MAWTFGALAMACALAGGLGCEPERSSTIPPAADEDTTVVHAMTDADEAAAVEAPAEPPARPSRTVKPWTPGPLPDDSATIVRTEQRGVDPETGFAVGAFPPTLPDIVEHEGAWVKNDCLRCHETGVQNAPIVRHATLPAIALEAKCRTCHVLQPGQTQGRQLEDADAALFAADAFPPMIPNSFSHRGAWTDNDCLLCHETGIRGAPVMQHGERLPRLAAHAKCRTCHVQVRTVDAEFYRNPPLPR